MQDRAQRAGERSGRRQHDQTNHERRARARGRDHELSAGAFRIRLGLRVSAEPDERDPPHRKS